MSLSAKKLYVRDGGVSTTVDLYTTKEEVLPEAFPYGYDKEHYGCIQVDGETLYFVVDNYITVVDDANVSFHVQTADFLNVYEKGRISAKLYPRVLKTSIAASGGTWGEWKNSTIFTNASFSGRHADNIEIITTHYVDHYTLDGVYTEINRGDVHRYSLSRAAHTFSPGRVQFRVIKEDSPAYLW